MRGRKPIPNVIQLIKGARNAVPEEIPVLDGVLFEPPAKMTDAQKSIWRDAIENAPKGLLRSLDRDLLKIWVVAADLHDQATQEVNTNGMLVKTSQGNLVQSPYLPIINKQAQIMMKAVSELGFSPTSRGRTTLAGGGQKEANKFSKHAARQRA